MPSMISDVKEERVIHMENSIESGTRNIYWLYDKYRTSAGKCG